ncbi:MAG TPA: type II CAAX endopeptidase family protein [Archangium sp.]|nr:type II CAAX endopeptidase family protein [Archangium sp.]
MNHRILRHPFTCLILALALISFFSFIFQLLELFVGSFMRNSVLPRELALRSMYWTTLLNALEVTLALVWVGHTLEHRTPAELGLPLRGALRDGGWGALVGFALISTVVGLLALFGWYRLGAGPVETVGEEAREALLYAGGFVFVSCFEEVLFRGIGFRLLEEWLGSAAALLISSVLFGLIHLNNPDSTWFAVLAIALEAGVLLGAAYMLTRSLWFVIGIHWAWNWTLGSLFGVNVSGMRVDGVLDGALVGPVFWTGGAFGAEAGGVALLLCTAVGVGLTWGAARRGQWRPFLHWRRQRRAAAAVALAPAA